jgi:hypothetical protein
MSKTEGYKKRFIELFKEMEQELGTCAEVCVSRDNEVAHDGKIVRSSYKCTMRF